MQMNSISNINPSQVKLVHVPAQNVRLRTLVGGFIIALLGMSLPLPEAWAQEFTFGVTVSDGAVSNTITLGFNPAAANDTGFDTGLDVVAPPPPPSGAFDARFSNGSGDFLTDIRNSPAGTTTFDAKYQAGAGAGPITLSWDPSVIPNLGTFEIVDAINGTLFGPLDMSTVSSIDVSAQGGGLLASGLRIRVSPISPPTAVDDAATTDEDVATTISVLSNDSDADGTLDASSVSIGTGASNGTAVANADGTVTYTPSSDFNGTDTFTYTVNDDGGATSNAATVTVIVNAQPDAPVFIAALVSQTVPLGMAVSFQYQATDGDGDALTFALVDPPAGASIDAQTGAFTFQPAELGTVTIQVTVTDGSTTVQADVATLTVNDPNEAPVFTAELEDTSITLGETVSFQYQASDPNGDALTFALASPPPGATINAQTGAFSFTPETGGTFTLAITVSDGRDAAFSAVTISVNTPPAFVATLASQSIALGDTLMFTYTATDPDGNALVFGLMDAPAGASINAATGKLTFIPAAAGEAQIAAAVTDGIDTTKAVVATITVTDTNVAPVFTAELQDQTLTVGQTLQFTYIATDANGDALTFGLDAAPAGATIDVGTGVFTFVPSASGTYNIQATVSDGSVTTQAAPATITVRAANQAPVFTNAPETPSVPEGSVFTFDFDATDADGDPLTFSLQAAPDGATISAETGELSFTPPAPGAYLFTVAVNDGAATTTQDFRLTATAVTAAPIAAEDVYETKQGETLTVNAPGVLANDTDADTEAASLTAIRVADASNGTVIIETNGGFTYTPDAAFSGTDTFTYQVSDGANISNTATVTITVMASQDDDGITDEEEDGVDGDGDGQPDGDGNNDGIPDKEQSEVASGRMDGNGPYVTVAAPTGTSLLSVNASQTIPDATAPEAPRADETAAVFQFGINLDPQGTGVCDASASIELFLPSGAMANRYLKYGPTPDNATAQWYEYDNVSTRTNAQGRTVLTVNLTDGETGDSDLTANCVIQDPGAAIFRERVANETEDALPQQFSLQQNYPNPFNPSTSIAFAVPEQAFVTVEVYNLLGERVATVVAETLAPGRYQYAFDARDMASGLYVYRMSAKGFFTSRMMTLMK
ncbi:MAG: hypothetical protein RhofKO_08470 [Rhodothermales bacterium]